VKNAIDSFRSITGWALFVVLIAATLALGANRPVSWTLMALAVMALFILTLVLDMVQRRPRVFDRLWLPALLFIAAMGWGVVQILPGLMPEAWAHPVWDLAPDVPPRVGADPMQGLHVLMRYATYAMVFWMALRSAADIDTALRYLRAFALFSIALAGFGIYAASTGENPILGSFASSNVSASFINRNSYATFAAFGLVTCLGLLLRAATREQGGRGNALAGLLRGITAGGWIWIAGLTLCGGAIMLSLSRGGAIAAVIGVLALLSSQRIRGNAAAVGPVLIVGGIVLAIFISGATGTFNRVITTSDENGRFAVYPAIVEAISERPLLGHGIGSFVTAFRAWVPVDAASGEWDMAHNSYLENVFELGLPAAALFYLALGLIGLRLAIGVQKRQRNRTPVSVALACFLLAGFHALFDFSLQMPALTAFFAWILGIGYAQSFPSAALKDGPQ